MAKRRKLEDYTIEELQIKINTLQGALDKKKLFEGQKRTTVFRLENDWTTGKHKLIQMEVVENSNSRHPEYDKWLHLQSNGDFRYYGTHGCSKNPKDLIHINIQSYEEQKRHSEQQIKDLTTRSIDDLIENN